MSARRVSHDTLLNSPHLAGLLPDYLIKEHIKIDPLVDHPVREVDGRPVISFGLGSYGYDMRIGHTFDIFSNIGEVVDPLAFDPKMLKRVNLSKIEHDWRPLDLEGRWIQCDRCKQKVSSISFAPPHCVPKCDTPDYVIIPPNCFVLGESVERFEIPRDVLAIVMGKSTYARCGLVVNVTPGEPEWDGRWTIEVSNTTPLPAKLYAGQGVAQVMFFRSLADCDVSYKDKKGKYQGQTGLTHPRG